MMPIVRTDQNKMGHMPHPPSLKCSYMKCIFVVLQSPRVLHHRGTARRYRNGLMTEIEWPISGWFRFDLRRGEQFPCLSRESTLGSAFRFRGRFLISPRSVCSLRSEVVGDGGHCAGTASTLADQSSGSQEFVIASSLKKQKWRRGPCCSLAA